jgi:hypothetical protein
MELDNDASPGPTIIQIHYPDIPELTTSIILASIGPKKQVFGIHTKNFCSSLVTSRLTIIKINWRGVPGEI